MTSANCTLIISGDGTTADSDTPVDVQLVK
jgi:hypothetical protein